MRSTGSGAETLFACDGALLRLLFINVLCYENGSDRKEHDNRMVLVAIDIEPKLFDRITGAVSQHGYSSVQQFLTAAAWNQITLHEGDHETPLTMGPQPISTDGAPDLSASQEWRRLLRRTELAAPVEGLSTGSYSGPEALLWGQTNRVLPIAVGVRALANLQADSGEASIELDQWHDKATKVAQLLRMQLESWDETANRGRSDKWATALPSADPASANRYRGQFLGWPRRDGRIAEGGAIWLGFVAFTDVQGSRVALTDAGSQWATFANPIFDGDAPQSTFSRDETVFFLDHLRDKRATEFKLLSDVARLVEVGKSRTEIDSALKEIYPTWAKHVSTMRAGALGRLSDLGLLTRTRHGLEVSYHLTPLAGTARLIEDAEEKAS